MEISRSVFIFNNTVAPYNSYLIIVYAPEKPAYSFFWQSFRVVFVHNFQDFYVMLLNSFFSFHRKMCY